jgi:hypothetical protein
MTQEQRRAAKNVRQNTRDSATVMATFFALMAAEAGGFRQDTELVVATQAFFTLMVHRMWPSI